MRDSKNLFPKKKGEEGRVRACDDEMQRERPAEKEFYQKADRSSCCSSNDPKFDDTIKHSKPCAIHSFCRRENFVGYP